MLHIRKSQEQERPWTKVLPDILIPFCLPSVHTHDYLQKNHALFDEPQSCPCFY